MTTPLRIRAVNTAADSENKIHDDRVAAQYGFKGGLVPGVTVYGYLAAAAIEHFGLTWTDRGCMDVRFQQPVYEGEQVEIARYPESGSRVRVEIAGKASGMAWLGEDPAPSIASYAERPMPVFEDRPAASAETLAPGLTLGTLVERLDLTQSKMSAPLEAAIGPDRRAHPAVLLALVNQVLVRNVALGPWIHAASEVRKFSAARDGEMIRVRAVVEHRFERKGHEFVVLRAVILGDRGRLVEQVRHTAIWRPRGGHDPRA